MNIINRRSALTLGLTAAATTVISDGAAAQPYPPTQGKEIAPGVRVVDLGKRASMVPGYKTVSMRDVVYQAGAKSINPSMGNDMVCHCAEGEIKIKQGPGMEFVAKKGDVWSCSKGSPEDGENVGTGVAIMRVIDLLPA